MSPFLIGLLYQISYSVLIQQPEAESKVEGQILCLKMRFLAYRHFSHPPEAV